MLTKGQVQVGSLLMGEGTPYRVLKGFNPWARSVRTPATGDRSWAHGSWSGAEWAQEVTVPIPVMACGVDDTVESWEVVHQALSAAFAAVGTNGDMELRWNLGTREYVMFGRPRMVSPDPEMIGLGFATTQCAFACPDPLIYAGEETVVGPITPPTWSGGWSLPFTFPFSFGSAALIGGEDTLSNEGTVPAGMVLRVDGPCLNPTVTVTQGSVSESLTISTTVASGDYLEIDTAARTVFYNGTINQRGYFSGDWPLVPVGDSTVRYRASEGTGQLTVTFRSAWW